MMNAGNLKGKTRQTNDWRRRMIAFVSALTLLISSCGLTAFAETDEDIYSDPVTAPIPAANTSPEPEEGEAEATPAPEDQPETGTEPQEATGEGTETEGEPEVSEEPEDLTVYEPGTLTAEADGVGITVDYTAEARVPEGAALTLARATGGDLYSALKSASKVLKTEENATWKRELGEDAVFYAITLTDSEGNEVHPETGVTLTCTNLEIPADATGFVTGDNAENIDWKDTLTVGFLPDAIGYAYLKQVQIGTVTLTHEDRDYMVTAAYGPDAGFPAGTELKVREILPGTPEYALYSGMTDEALNEDWAEITLERYFDIAFVVNGEEMEPKADVDVQIVFRDKIEQNEETEVAAVHIENNEANVIEAETDSTKSARHDDEAIDTVTFTSDSFSVYGVVQKKKIITKVLAADGNTYEIEISYTQEAEIPEESQVKVEEIPEGSDLWEAYRKQTAAALNADDVRLPGLYDISIIDAEGAKIEPKAPVSVSIKLANAEANNEDLHVVHFTEEIPQELVEAEAKPEEQTEGQTEEQTTAQPEPLAEEEKIASEKITATVEDNTVTFETQSFSVYAFAYTVDFYFGVDGEVVEYHIPGGSVMGLRELLPILKIVEDDPSTEKDEILQFIDSIQTVTFTDESLIRIVHVDENTTAGDLIDALGVESTYSGSLTDDDLAVMRAKLITAPDWVLVSLKPFLSEEQLTITLKNGEVIIIKVTDAADPDIFRGKTVIIYDNTERRAMAAINDSYDSEKRFISVPESGADSNADARWVVEYSNNNYYLRTSSGKYMVLYQDHIGLADSQSQATALVIQPGGNPDYQIYPKNASNAILTYNDNGQYDGFFGPANSSSWGTFRQWLYIREATSITNQFSVDVATWTSGSSRWGRLNSKYFGTENGNGIDGDRYPASGTTNGKLDTSDGKTKFNFGFGGVPNTGYQFAFFAYQENGLYVQMKEGITNTTVIPLNPTEYYAYFTPQGKKLFIYQSENTGKGTVNKTHGYSDQTGATATPASGNIFIGWFDANGSCVSFDPQFDVTKASSSMVLTARFRQLGSVTVNVSVNDLNGGDIYLTNGSRYNNGAQAQDHTTDNYGRLDQTIKAVPKDGYVFAYWTLNGKQMEDKSDTIEQGKAVFSDNDQLQAVFLKIEEEIDATDGVNSDIELTDDKKQELKKWLESLHNHDVIAGDKTAHAIDYTNRIYEIDFNTESAMMDLAANVDIAFIVDVSNSMLFPANLVRTGQSMVLTQNTLNAAFPDGGTYYIISDPSSTSTVYKIFRKADGLWYAVDASYSDDRAILVDLNNKYADITKPVPNAYPIYRAKNNIQRKVYLQQSITKTLDSLNDILSSIEATGGSTQGINIAWNTFAHNLKSSSGKFTPLTPGFNIEIGETDGGTHQDIGLNNAAGFNWSNTDQKYAILITDGAPNDSNAPNIFQDVRDAATNLKNVGVKLITVGLSTVNVSEGSRLLKEIADLYPGTNSHMFFQAESGSDLENILLEVLRLIMNKKTVSGEITDTIDPAFYPVNGDGIPLEEGYYNLDGTPFNGDGVNSGVQRYKLEYDDSLGVWKVKFFNLIFNANTTFSIKVKAKEDFLGGNKINTNVDNAEIKPIWWHNPAGPVEWPPFEAGQVRNISLPSPMVNVDELQFTNNNSEETVNLGQIVTPINNLKEHFANIAVKEVVSASDTDHRRTENSGKITDGDSFVPETYLLKTVTGELTDDQWTILINDGTISIPYNAYSHNAVGAITLKLTKVANVLDAEIDYTQHNTTAVGSPAETYTLSAVYTPASSGAATTYEHTTVNQSAGDLTNGITSQNPHVINVLENSTTINVAKIWQGSDAPAGASVQLTLRRYKQVGGNVDEPIVITDPEPQDPDPVPAEPDPVEEPEDSDMVVNVRVTSWKDQNGNPISAPSEGGIWYQIQKDGNILQNSQINKYANNWNETFTVENVVVGETYWFNYPSAYQKWENNGWVTYGTATILSGTDANRNFEGRAGTVYIDLEITINASESSSNNTVLTVKTDAPNAYNPPDVFTVQTKTGNTVEIKVTGVPEWAKSRWQEIGFTYNNNTAIMNVLVEELNQVVVLGFSPNQWGYMGTQKENLTLADKGKNGGKSNDHFGIRSFLDIFIPSASADGIIEVAREVELPETPVDEAEWQADTTWVLDGTNVTGSNGEMVVTLSGTNWSQSFTVDQLDENGNAYLYVLENVAESGFDTTGWSASITNSVVFGDYTNTGNVLSVTNTHSTNPPGSLSISKMITNGSDATGISFEFDVVLTNPNGNAYTGSVAVTDASRTNQNVTAEEGGIITVTVNGAGTASIANIPAGVTYTVSETVPDNWKLVSIDPENGQGTIASNQTAVVTVTNEELTSVYAKKVWQQGTETMAAWPAGKTVTFQLQKNTAEEGQDPVWVVATDTDGITVADIVVSSFAQVSYTNLPAGVEYRVIETEIDGTVLTTPIVAAGTGTAADPFTVTNKYLTVNKQWVNVEGTTVDWPKDGEGNYTPAYVTVQLQRRANSSDVFTDVNGAVQNIYPEEGEGQLTTARFDNLDPAYEYTVAETAIDGVKSTIVTNADGSITVKNLEVPTVDIEAQKEWNNVPEEDQVNAVQFTLYQKIGDGQATAVEQSATLTNPQAILKDQDWSGKATWSNLPAYDVTGETPVAITYSVEETGIFTGDLESGALPADPTWTPAATRYTVSGNGNVSFSEGSNSAAVIITNKKITVPQLKVTKEWYNVLPEDLVYYPTVYFTLYQMKATDNNFNDAHIYRPGGEGDDSFVNIPLSYAEGWTWTCDYLPETDDQGNPVKYFAAERTADGNVGTRTVYLDDPYWNVNDNVRVQTIEYKSRSTVGTGAWDRKGEPNNPNDAWVGNSGEILIRNTALDYMQMDVKKKFLYYYPNQGGYGYSLGTGTSEAEYLHDRVIVIQVMRRAVIDDGSNTEAFGWQPYGEPIAVGYGPGGVSDHIEINGINGIENPFTLIYSSAWEWYIHEHGGLIGFGFYTVNNQRVRVLYQYTLKELGAYRDKGLTQPMDDFEWSAILPEVWDGYGRHDDVFPRVTAQDGDRLVNIQSTDIKISKEWSSPNTDVQEVYVKIYRNEGQNYNSSSTQDYTGIIGTTLDKTGLINTTDGYISSSSLTTINGETYIKVPADGSVVTISKVPTLHYADNIAQYFYWIEECGYKPINGDPVMNTDRYTVTYMVSNVDTLAGDSNRTGSAVIRLGGKGTNTFTILNTSSEGALNITKAVTTGSEADDEVFTFEAVLTPANGENIDTASLAVTGGALSSAVKDDNTGVVTVTLTITGTGTAVITGIPAGTTYVVTETDIPDNWKQSGDAEYSDPEKTVSVGETSDTVTITNTEVVNVTVKKTWSDTTTWPDDKLAVQMTLKANGETATDLLTYNDEEQTAVVTLTSVNATTGHTWYNLPKYNQESTLIDYTVEETGVMYNGDLVANWNDIFTVTTPTTDSSSDAIVIDNTPVETTIQVTKVWTKNGKSITPTETSIGFEVYQVVNGTATKLDSVMTAVGDATPTLNSSPTVEYVGSSWQTVTVSGLPAYILTANGYAPASYYVVETGVTGNTKITYQKTGAESDTDTPSEAATSSGLITIYNKDYEIDINVLKVEETTRTATTQKPLKDAVFKLEKYAEATEGTAAGYNAYPNAEDAQKTSGDDGKLTFTGLPDGKYRITEVTPPPGYYNGAIVIYFKIENGIVTYTDEAGNRITEQEYVTYTPQSAENGTVAEFVVGNTPGAELPATGGSGTLIYTITGIFLITLAGTLLVARKRKANR